MTMSSAGDGRDVDLQRRLSLGLPAPGSAWSRPASPCVAGSVEKLGGSCSVYCHAPDVSDSLVSQPLDVEQVVAGRVGGAEQRPVGVDGVLHGGPGDRREARRAVEQHQPRRLLGEEDRRRRGVERRPRSRSVRPGRARRAGSRATRTSPRLGSSAFASVRRRRCVRRRGGGKLRAGDLDVARASPCAAAGRCRSAP